MSDHPSENDFAFKIRSSSKEEYVLRPNSTLHTLFCTNFTVKGKLVSSHLEASLLKSI